MAGSGGQARRDGPLKEWFERFENDGDLRTYPIKRVDGIPVVMERYVRGEIGIDFHVGVLPGRGDVDAEYFVVRASLPAHAGSEDDADRVVGVTVVELLGGRRLVDEYMGQARADVEHAVFVDVRKFAEGVERIERVRRCGMVRLHRLHLRRVLGVDVLEEPVPAPRRGGIDDRELDLFRLAFRRLTPEVLQRELPPQVIEG